MLGLEPVSPVRAGVREVFSSLLLSWLCVLSFSEETYLSCASSVALFGSKSERDIDVTSSQLLKHFVGFTVFYNVSDSFVISLFEDVCGLFSCYVHDIKLLKIAQLLLLT